MIARLLRVVGADARAQARLLKRRMLRGLAFGALGAVCLLFGIGFGAAALAVALMPLLGPWQALTVVSGGLIVLALGCLLVAKRAARRHAARPTDPPEEAAPDDALALVVQAFLSGLEMGRHRKE